jgi:hypothetical protein
VTAPYATRQLLAMELDRSHIGHLVQLIAEDWSVTGYLARVDQYDNRDYEIDYANGGRLVPSGGEIYAYLKIGPWHGKVIGNQPVTVEYAGAEIDAVDPVRQVEAPDVIQGELE